MNTSKVTACFFVLFLLFLFSPKHIQASFSYSAWQPLNSLPYELASHQSFAINNNLYVLGGGDSSTYRSDIYSAQINNDATIGVWQKRGDIPSLLIWHSSSIKGNFLYILGGAKQNPDLNHVSTVNTVYRAEVDISGNVTNWSTENNLPSNLGRGGSFIANNKIYFVGGLIKAANSSTENVVSTVYFADINQDGSLGPWSQTNSLPQTRAEFATFLYGNKVYIVGGMQANASPANTVFIGTIDQMSGVISWVNSQTLPLGLRRPAGAQVNNLFFLIGGYDGASFTNSTYISQLDLDGNLTSWTSISPLLPHSDCCNQATSVGNSVYLTGGHDGNLYYNDTLQLTVTPGLPVPNIKQYSAPWGAFVYDNASIWSPLKDTINRFGCALTSAVMILQYYGYTITPDLLNTWLLNNNGYISNGLVDWSAITRWVKLAHETNLLLPKLEYGRAFPFTSQALDSELNANHPAIVKLVRPSDSGTHFVVVTGKDGNDYFINDPASTQTHLSYYSSNQYNRVDTFTPSNTDLSYLYFYSSSNTSFTVTKPDGQLINSGFMTEGPYVDQTDLTLSNMSVLNTFSLAKPTPGTYLIRLTGNGNYNSSSRLYDVNALLNESKDQGVLHSGQIKTYLITIGDIQSTDKIDFNFIHQNLKKAFNNNKIKNTAVYKTLLSSLDSAESYYSKGKVIPARLLIDSMITEVKLSKKLIDASYSIVLTNYLRYLEDGF